MEEVEFEGPQCELVEVVWDDHAFFYGPYDPDNLMAVQTSTGYFIAESKEVMVIAQSHTETHDHEEYGECLNLDKRTIRSITNVRTGKGISIN